MTILYVDVEHERVRRDAVRGPRHRRKLERGRLGLELAAAAPCQVVGFEHLSLSGVRDLAPTAMVLSGSTTDWGEYDFAALEGLFETIRAAPVPLLGICAGHQLIGYAHGATWGPLGALSVGETDPDSRFAPGQRKERGFLTIQVDPRCALFDGLGPTASLFQSHYWQLHTVPSGFVGRATSPWSPVQAIERLDRPVFGVQFHPERHEAAHPAGKTILRNFFARTRPR